MELHFVFMDGWNLITPFSSQEMLSQQLTALLSSNQSLTLEGNKGAVKIVNGLMFKYINDVSVSFVRGVVCTFYDAVLYGALIMGLT